MRTYPSRPCAATAVGGFGLSCWLIGMAGAGAGSQEVAEARIGHREAAQMVVAGAGGVGWLGGWLVLLLLQRPTGQGGHGGCFWWHLSFVVN